MPPLRSAALSAIEFLFGRRGLARSLVGIDYWRIGASFAGCGTSEQGITFSGMAAILRSTLSMSVATTLSRITGYARTMVQAAVPGTGAVANAYTFERPTQLYELFMGGLLSSIFVPLLVDRLTRYGEDDACRLTNALLSAICRSSASWSSSPASSPARSSTW